LSSLQPVRGTHDLLPDDARRHRWVNDRARGVAARFGYQEIETPIFEFTEVFKRTLGDVSDIVTKEMYTFTDRGGEQLTLRPEATASVARALVSGGLAQHLPLKFFYQGPMFRYERPQKGRLRQFHQIGIELLGVPGPEGDVEVIGCGYAILKALGFADRITLEINSLGDAASRQAYRARLVEFFRAHEAKLSADSKERLGRNPLRILDSKDESDRRIVAEAPLFGDFLNAESRAFFGAVTDGLETLGVPYRLNPRLVRGLDYYCHTAFEFTTESLGAQGTVMGGGRYDGLVETMGGPPTPGCGWAAGVERLAMMLDDLPPPPRPVAVLPVGAEAAKPALRLSAELRDAGFSVELGYGGNLGKRLKRADRLKASVALILGEDELKRGVVTLRDLDSGAQEDVALGALKDRLAPYR